MLVTTPYRSILMLTLAGLGLHADPIPTKQLEFIDSHCLECHDSDTAKADLDLEHESIDWRSKSTRHHWDMIYTMVSRNKMPPRKKDQPTTDEKRLFLSWLDEQLTTHSPIGGSAMRRLNRREYQATIRDLFRWNAFALPLGFPTDNESHGFDTIGESLVVSPSHIEAYAETATIVADAMFPPKAPPISPKDWHVPPEEMAISYSSGAVVDGAMRLASSGSFTRNASSTAKFEAPTSGTYLINITLSAKNPPAGNDPIFSLGAKPNGKGSSRMITSIPIKPGPPKQVSVTVDLYKGENLVFSYDNAPLRYEKDAKAAYRAHLEENLANAPKLAAAWAAVDKLSILNKNTRGVPRGGIGWERVKEKMKDPKLDAKAFTPGSKELNSVIEKMLVQPVSSGETIVYRYFEQGPNIGIHDVKINGPHTSVIDPETNYLAILSKGLLGNAYGKSDKSALASFLQRYLSRAFRRPATPQEVDAYYQLIEQQLAAGNRLEDGLHLVIRTSLLSTHFLYRERGNELTNYELAARLSYFLGTLPPTDTLDPEKLTNPAELRKNASKYISQKQRTKQFISDFTSQWLDTNRLDTLMPDPKLFPKFNDSHRAVMKEEVILTFAAILDENRPTIDFIDPDFIFADASIAQGIYQLDGKDKKPGNAGVVKRMAIKRGTRRGGLLTMPAIMTATANGVDTQPVLRGVWMLNNILGMPPPEPPKAVPALTPDTTGAKTPRERLAAHTTSPSCASCHEDIDPVGFVLESLDPVGKWRTTYPKVGKQKPLRVETDGTLPDGTKLRTVVDLKKWLVDHPTHFNNCLAQKLLVYATGRPLNYRERKIISAICTKNLEKQEGFKDLLLDLIDSDIFRAR
jgi:hypothetical protein